MKYLLIQAALLLVILVTGLALIGPTEEPFTELYFTQHTLLPGTLSPPPYTIERLQQQNYSFYRFTFVNESREFETLDILESTKLNESRTNELFPLTALANDSRFANAFVATGQLRFRPTGTYKESELYVTESFSFTINNLEGQTTAYEYEITQTDAGSESIIIDVGSVTLQNNESTSVESDFTVWQGFNRTRIQIQLVDKPQRIHFWVAEQ
jgi:hypothetical protein